VRRRNRSLQVLLRRDRRPRASRLSNWYIFFIVEEFVWRLTFLTGKDVCHPSFVWRSALACRLCNESEIIEERSACVGTDSFSFEGLMYLTSFCSQVTLEKCCTAPVRTASWEGTILRRSPRSHVARWRSMKPLEAALPLELSSLLSS
jgi:hypothetical protein